MDSRLVHSVNKLVPQPLDPSYSIVVYFVILRTYALRYLHLAIEESRLVQCVSRRITVRVYTVFFASFLAFSGAVAKKTQPFISVLV